MSIKLIQALFSFYLSFFRSLFIFVTVVLLLYVYLCYCVVCVYVHVYLHVSMCMWVGSISVCVCMDVHMGAHAWMCTYAHVCTCMWIHMCVHTTCWCQMSSPLFSLYLLKSLPLKLVDAAIFTNQLAPGAPILTLLKAGTADGPNFPVGSCDPLVSSCLFASKCFVCWAISRPSWPPSTLNSEPLLSSVLI